MDFPGISGSGTGNTRVGCGICLAKRLYSGCQAGGGSSDDLFHDVAVDVGEAEITAGVAVGEAFVVDAEEVEHGGVEVVDAHAVFNGFEPEIVGGAVNGAAFETEVRF